MPQEVFWGPMTKICILGWAKKCITKSKGSFGSKCSPNSFGVANDQKCQKLKETEKKPSNFYFPNSHLGVRSPMTQICIFGQKCQNLQKKRKKNSKNLNCHKSAMHQKVILGSLMTKICICWGPNYLPHVVTNIASLCFATHSFLQGRQF